MLIYDLILMVRRHYDFTDLSVQCLAIVYEALDPRELVSPIIVNTISGKHSCRTTHVFMYIYYNIADEQRLHYHIITDMYHCYTSDSQ